MQNASAPLRALMYLNPLTYGLTGLREALQRIPEIRAEFWKNVTVPGSHSELNQALEKANRVADFLEFAELKRSGALKGLVLTGCLVAR